LLSMPALRLRRARTGLVASPCGVARTLGRLLLCYVTCRWCVEYRGVLHARLHASFGRAAHLRGSLRAVVPCWRGCATVRLPALLPVLALSSARAAGGLRCARTHINRPHSSDVLTHARHQGCVELKACSAISGGQVYGAGRPQCTNRYSVLTTANSSAVSLCAWLFLRPIRSGVGTQRVLFLLARKGGTGRLQGSEVKLAGEGGA